MTIQIYSKRVTPDFTAADFERSQEELEAIFPLKADKIDEVNQAAIVADGTKWGPDMLDIPALQDALASEGGGADISALSTLLGMQVEYKDGISFYVLPGQCLCKGRFKRQGLDTDTNRFLIVNAAAALIPGECAPSAPGTSGLDKSTFYYVYAGLGVATTYPTYYVTTVRPVTDDGYGPIHPNDDSKRFIGTILTDDTDDAFIRPFWRYATGWVFWREILVGPGTATDDLEPGATAGYVTVDLSGWVPPTADCARVAWYSDGQPDYLRVKGDSATTSGYSHDAFDTGTAIQLVSDVPVNITDPTTDEQIIGTEVEVQQESGSPRHLAVVGYHESLI